MVPHESPQGTRPPPHSYPHLPLQPLKLSLSQPGHPIQLRHVRSLQPQLGEQRGVTERRCTAEQTHHMKVFVPCLELECVERSQCALQHYHVQNTFYGVGAHA
jgi:hypothetical protein